MSPKSVPFILAVGFLLTAMMAGMAVTWGWAIRKLALGQPLLPPAKPRPVPWGIGSVVLVVFAWLAANMGVGLVYMSLTGEFAHGSGKSAPKTVAHDPRTFTFTEQMVLLSAINGVLLPLIPAVLRVTSGARLDDLGVTLRGFLRPAWYGVVSFLLVAPVVYLLNGIAVVAWTQMGGKPDPHPLEKMVRGESSPGVIALAVLSAVILAPAAEELIFRGVVQRWLTRVLRPRQQLGAPEVEAVADGLAEGTAPVPEDVNVAVARFPRSLPAAVRLATQSRGLPIVLTSGLFAILHIAQWPAPMAIFFLSLGLGLVYERTGSLVSSFTMHAMFNGLGTLLLFLTLVLPQPPAKKADAPAGGVVKAPHADAVGKHR
jgi:membrane protease YdiL (CAAX protease family)